MVTPAATQRYLAEFHGRTKGAIGIFHACSMFVDLDPALAGDERDHAARLQIYEYYEHVTGLRYTPLVVRYVATYVQRDGVRTLMTVA